MFKDQNELIIIIFNDCHDDGINHDDCHGDDRRDKTNHDDGVDHGAMMGHDGRNHSKDSHNNNYFQPDDHVKCKMQCRFESR